MLLNPPNSFRFSFPTYPSLLPPALSVLRSQFQVSLQETFHLIFCLALCLLWSSWYLLLTSFVKPASHYKLIRRFRRSRRCCGSCRDFRLTTGTLRLADARAQTDIWIGDPSAKTKHATPFPDHCMTKKCPACDNILNVRPTLYVNKAHHYPFKYRRRRRLTYYRSQNGMMQSIFCTSTGAIDDGMTAQ